MPIAEPAFFLICYDISDQRRLRMVHKILADEALALQYSVFLTRLRPARLAVLMSRIEEVIDDKQDDVRAYRLRKDPEVVFLGKRYFPEGVTLANGDVDWLQLWGTDEFSPVLVENMKTI